MYQLKLETLPVAIFNGKTSKMGTIQQHEKELERACVAYARGHGWAAWKNEKNGNKGIPDFSFLSHEGNLFMLVEFKRHDGKGRLSPEQKVWRDRFPSVIWVFDDFDDFKEFIGE